MNAFIIHGSFGSPEENWFPWLEGELEKLGVKVFVPRFPTPEGQSLAAWTKAFEDYRQHLSEKNTNCWTQPWACIHPERAGKAG